MSATTTNNNNGQGVGYYYDPLDGPRTSRRTPMACQFCRARKLKCDGLRPQCTNCARRNCACNYIPVSQTTK
ncbi:Zn(2)-C6 fungal-type domain-containing protein [Mycena indigotica]|uniref:Zn(2)-C6 fungal-type domain-containing protein n=1 Tax=Mycena indigotica TaxID=2126181 RepID=A0A8H6VZB8_9AGAR|nr:Zn(2)-C6 fungal-type domain-containing protein [Mycena indigotica]KAF7297361.1 Zn(2)-C6 fungal-type domain-containing protein [Mycena indigotica]